MADRCSCSSPHRATQCLAKLRRASSLCPSSEIRARARGSLGPTAIQSRDLNTIPGEISTAISTVSISIVRSKAAISTHGAYWIERSDQPRHASSGPDLGQQRERAETGSMTAERESWDRIWAAKKESWEGKQRKRECVACFRKMVYGKFFRKSFS